MATLEQIKGMYDSSLKPRLLRSLIKELPDEKHPFQNSKELPNVVAAVKTHRLLSESASQSTDQKQIENWKSAVDAWVNRLLALVSSNMPDKCWAGILLLGLTCQECSSERFLASYSVWFHKLLSHIQPPAESHLMKVASCASISDLFTRLGGYPNVKKDGTSHAAKVILPVMKLLNEDNFDAVGEGAICLICTVINFFPASIHRHYDSVEAAVVSKIMSGKCSADNLKKLGHCLALLPKSRGDEDSWSVMMQKILISINVHLKDAFQGLEEESKSDEAMRVLVQPGKDPPPPLGGQTMSFTSDQAAKRPERFLMSSVSTLLCCCCSLLTNSYPVQITVPVQPLLLLAWRVLMVDGSPQQALYPFMTTMRQELICSELPVLHLNSLELLSAIVKEVRSQLLPHVAEIVRLITDYFRRCTLPNLRIKVYSIIRILLLSMGVGMALHLNQDVINNTFVDLDYIGYTSGDSYSNADANTSYDTLMHPSPKKRKHVNTTGSFDELTDKVGFEVIRPKIPTPISVKIAALEALEALLTVGGALGSESWRPNVDCLLMTIATDACKGGWAKEEKNDFLTDEHTMIWADFQLVAVRALLASLLSPGRVRPPYLAQGLELFRRGMQETGSKLAEFCAHALLTLEVLIHPRALPLIDFSSGTMNSYGGKNRFPDNSSDPNFNTTFSGGTLGKGPGDPESDEDDLSRSWLSNADEVDVAVAHPENNTIATERPSVVFKEPLTEIINEESLGQDVATAFVTEKHETIHQSEEAISGEDGVGAVFGDSMSIQFDRNVLDSGAVETVESSQDISTVRSDKFTTAAETTAATTSKLERGMGFISEFDTESSMDSLPDIVDGDPDSD